MFISQDYILLCDKVLFVGQAAGDGTDTKMAENESELEQVLS